MSRPRPAPLEPLSDAEQLALAARCVAGDHAAREAFLERFGRLVYAVIGRILAREGRAGREDLIEDLFGQAFAALFGHDARRLRQWDRKCSLASWVRVVTASTVIDALRAAARADRTRADGADPGELPARGPSALDAVVRAEDLGRLALAMDAVSASDREILRMIFVEEIPPGAVAERLGIPAGALYTRKNRAIERLRLAFFGNAREDGDERSSS